MPYTLNTLEKINLTKVPNEYFRIFTQQMREGNDYHLNG